MNDIRIVQGAADFGITLDWMMTPQGGLDTSQQLASAIITALGTDRLADPSDILPGDDNNRRGWWGDLETSEIWNGWPIGSRLWLLERSKITGQESRDGSTVGRVETYIREAIQPFLDHRIIGNSTVLVERNGTGRIDALIRLYRGTGDVIDLRFNDLWSDIGN